MGDRQTVDSAGGGNLHGGDGVGQEGVQVHGDGVQSQGGEVMGGGGGGEGVKSNERAKEED